MTTSTAVTPPMRTIGQLIAASGLLLTVANTPGTLAQSASFAPAWTAGASDAQISVTSANNPWKRGCRMRMDMVSSFGVDRGGGFLGARSAVHREEMYCIEREYAKP